VYNYLTFAQAQSALASRLQDPNLVYWNQPNELLNYIIESVRFFQALTGSYKQRVVFPTTANVSYYDLPNVAAPGSGNLAAVSYNVTDVEVANNVLAALLEPPLSGTWAGTGQFTLNQLQTALQNRVNRFLGETGRRVVQQNILGPIPPSDLTSLPDNTLDVRRAAWMSPPSGQPPFLASPLGRIDEWAEQAYVPNAQQNPGTP
jgi:hypothetical protein